MKKTNILLAAILACIGLAMTPQARAQSYSPSSLALTNTTVPGAAAINCTSTFFCGKQQNWAVQLTCGNKLSTNTVVGLMFYRSIDGSSYTSDTSNGNGWLCNIALTNVAGTAFVNVTNAPTYMTTGSGYIKLAYITNSVGGNDITNVVVKVATKTMSP